MAVTIVNDYFFKPGGDVEEGKAGAAELLAYFKAEVPAVELSLWLEALDNPLHHYHITVFGDPSVIPSVRGSDAIKRFTDRLYPPHRPFDLRLAGLQCLARRRTGCGPDRLAATNDTVTHRRARRGLIRIDARRRPGH